MKSYFPLLAAGLLCGLLILLAAKRNSSDGAPDSVAASVPAAALLAAKAPTIEEVLANAKPDEKTLAHIQELEKMALEKRQRDEAAAKTHQKRLEIQIYRHNAWRHVIEDGRPGFEALRNQAALSPHKRVPCTICGAQGVLDLCAVCAHTGKCPTCRGTGKVLDGVCPACVGTGKCFLCRGSRKMPCPFCQSSPLMKEVITPDAPDPAADLPID